MTVEREVLSDSEQPAEVPTAVLVGYVLAGVGVFGWFLFGWLVQQQGFIASVGESAGAAFALLLGVSVIASIRRGGR
ncbi:hypothetical protein K7640_08010 [Micromonospora sp. PLK6-60]|uniref:hypothetical protein n=1 Tax=Micromonospora sp. PLK6-60 TaxID=2873383 RepID=UPI001CA6ED7F|nr:hypothetical protein [Micromonospora sp. PLK6-60]MBY8871784.1 hypothetical protein [Micromonospora sp. PLK6-60]